MKQPLIGPEVEHPTPWRVGERIEYRTVVVDARDSWVAEVPDQRLAELIVRTVNVAAEGGATE